MSHDSSSRIRWLIAGTFGPSPEGRLFPVSGERFSDVLERCRVALDVDVADRLGDGPTRTFHLSFTRPRDFRLEDVIGQQETLQALQDVAEALERTKDPISRREATQRVRALVGEGILVRALDEPDKPDEPDARTTSAPAARASAPQPDRPEGDRGDMIDAIFAKAETPGVDTGDQNTVAAARSGLDAFIGAIRGGAKTARVATGASPKDVAALIHSAIEQSALEILAHPRVAALEQAWRGLRMVVAESPGHDDLVIEAMDVTADAMTDAIEQRLGALRPELRPDAVFVTHGLDEASRAALLAAVGSRYAVVIVAGVAPSLWGARIDADGWPATRAALDPPESWSALREDPSTAWLVAAANPVIAANEPTAAGARLVPVDPAFGVAALLSAALGRFGPLEGAIGRRGAIRAPAAQDIEVRGLGPVTVPTRWPASLDAQRAASDVGVTLLGHDRDQILLAAAPTVCANEARQLPARIQIERTGRTNSSGL
jgi:type VI secretion system protein ImpC